MIRREITTDKDGRALILVVGSLGVVELHDTDGNIVEQRAATPSERAAHTAWEATVSYGRTVHLTRPRKGRK